VDAVMVWQIVLYESNNQHPVEDFIDSLRPPEKAKLARQMSLLKEFGPNLGMPHARPMGNGLYELRVRGQTEVRVFYIFAIGQVVYLLHGFVKKTQATPRQAMQLSLMRKKEIETYKLY
jgi:phage-related protein